MVKVCQTGTTANEAFTNDVKKGGWDIQLRGLWFAKYDTSLEYITESGDIQMVNSTIETTAADFNKIYSTEQKFRATSKPYRITWRNISFSSAYSQALMYYSKLPNASQNRDLNSHMMKSSEWDVLSNITANENFGIGIDKLRANTKNNYASGSDGINSFSVANCTSQTSNGNMTGIFDVIGTTKVMLPTIDVIEVEPDINTHSEFIYNNSGEPINRFINNIDIMDEFDLYPNKYMNFRFNTGMSDSTIKLAENGSLSSDTNNEWKTVDGCINQRIGFRLVLANSASSDRDNFIYDNVNITEIAGENLPGFYVTDENGNYIRNEFGEYKDSNGNPTFYSWDTMKNNNWVYMQDGTLYAGANVSQLKSKTGILVISDDVTNIGSYSFLNWNSESATDEGDKGLLKLVMSNNIINVNSYAFSNCGNLFEIEFSEKLKEIGRESFSYCSSLVNFSFPVSLEKIGIDSFFYCNSIESVVIPSRVKEIGAEAFDWNFSLKNIVFQSEVEDLKLGNLCFASTKVSNVVIPGNISKIPAGMFSGCVELENVVIEKGVEVIYSGAFSGCAKLKNINFPETIIQLGDDQETVSQGGVFENCISLEKVELYELDNLKYISHECFKGCTALSEVYLPLESLEDIRVEAFYNCTNLRRITLPNTIKEFGTRAFGNDTGLLDKMYIEYKGSTDEWNAINIDVGRTYTININEIKEWFKNITIEVETTDNEQILYEPDI